MNKHWYHHRLTAVSCLLWPLSWLYRLVIAVRRLLYRCHILRTHQVAAPVIVVGNLSVGGTGKSPMVIWLVAWLRRRGFEPGIISRGYGARNNKKPIQVSEQTTATDVGDEPLMLYQRLGCPVVICADRVKAAQYCLEHNTCDILVADDGLSHYALDRDLEIVMMDGERRMGNMQCLPAGPLREPLSRLKYADMLVATNGNASDNYLMHLLPKTLEHVNLQENPLHLSAIVGRRVHAVAGIGHPERFFDSLRALGADVIEHPFPDHHVFTPKDLQFSDQDIIVMTEKDAVKCAAFAPESAYYLLVSTELNEAFVDTLITHLPRLRHT